MMFELGRLSLDGVRETGVNLTVGTANRLRQALARLQVRFQEWNALHVRKRI